MQEAALPLRVTFDRQANAAYIYISDSIDAGAVARTEVGQRSTVNLDFDDHDRLIGIEVLDATRTLPPDLLRRVNV